MEGIIESLNLLTLAELQKVDAVIRNKIQKFEKDKFISDLKDEVHLNGYAWRIKSISDFADPNIQSTYFPVNIDVFTYEKEDKTDCHVDDLSEEQNDWVDYMSFDYIPKDSDDWEVSHDEEKWNYGDWDDPATGKATMVIQIFYKIQSPPNEGEIFECFDDEGNIEKWKVENGKLYNNNKYFNEIDKWNEYDIFILKNSTNN